MTPDAFAELTDTTVARSVAVVGLGTGTTSCYSRPGEQWTYFEIDPVVVRFARTPRLFTYLRDCAPDAKIVLGDARISLAQVPDSSYDLIVLDAFSSDAIPIHLMTREALALYLRKLKPRGVVLYHISNRYLRLEPVLVEVARSVGAFGAVGERNPTTEERAKLYYGARWVAVSRDSTRFDPLIFRRGWLPLADSAGVRVWTDDYSDVLGVVKWREAQEEE
jgi:spermidine synthase